MTSTTTYLKIFLSAILFTTVIKASDEGSSPFLDSPQDIRSSIVHFLNAPDICALERTCRAISKEINADTLMKKHKEKMKLVYLIEDSIPQIFPGPEKAVSPGPLVSNIQCFLRLNPEDYRHALESLVSLENKEMRTTDTYFRKRDPKTDRCFFDAPSSFKTGRPGFEGQCYLVCHDLPPNRERLTMEEHVRKVFFIVSYAPLFFTDENIKETTGKSNPLANIHRVLYDLPFEFFEEIPTKSPQETIDEFHKLYKEQNKQNAPRSSITAQQRVMQDISKNLSR